MSEPGSSPVGGPAGGPAKSPASGPAGEPASDAVSDSESSAAGDSVSEPASSPPGGVMSGRRGMLIALAVTALGAVLVLVTAGQPRRSLGGAQMVGGGAPAATALALVALAGLGLLLLVQGRARSLIGVLLILTGAAVVLVDVYASHGGFFAYSPLAKGQVELHRTAWFWATAAGGVVLASGGLLIAIWGHRWPGTRRDYRARADPSPVRRDAWTALDRGEDPTV